MFVVTLHLTEAVFGKDEVSLTNSTRAIPHQHLKNRLFPILKQLLGLWVGKVKKLFHCPVHLCPILCSFRSCPATPEGMCQDSPSVAPEVEGLQIYSCPDLLRPGQEFIWHQRGLWIIYLSPSVKQEHALILTILLPALREGVADGI